MLPVFGWKIIEEGEQSLSILNQTLGYPQACPSPPRSTSSFIQVIGSHSRNGHRLLAH